MPTKSVLSRSSLFQLKRMFNSKLTVPIRSTTKALSTSCNNFQQFPCLEKLIERDQSYLTGPEPSYINVPKSCKTFHHPHPILLDNGSSLPQFDLVYETWGNLNANKDNCILLHTGLSASSHARSSLDLDKQEGEGVGWWEKFIGPGKALDTDKFFIVCCNVLGGCYGSTGPSSYLPETKVGEGKIRYATNFPIISLFDMVRAQMLLIDSLGIGRLYASVGASMGGMQSLAVGALFGRERVAKVITISACARSHPYSIAQRFVQRQVLMTDPNWNKGFYYEGKPPHVGMKLAREIATITYRSGPEWEERFGRKRSEPNSEPALCPDYLIETYLDHQGEKFCLNYDANSLLYISKAMDNFDLSASALRQLQVTGPQLEPRFNKLGSIKDDLTQGLALLEGIHTLVLGVQSDILFPYWQQKEIATQLKLAGNRKVHYYELDSIYGHDTFLIDLNNVAPAIKGHLEHSW